MEMCKRYAVLFTYFLNASLIKSYYQKESANLIFTMPLKILIIRLFCRYLLENHKIYKYIILGSLISSPKQTQDALIIKVGLGCIKTRPPT